jgi:hypothetical protein
MGKVKHEPSQNMKQALGVKVTEKNSWMLCVKGTYIQQYNKPHNPYFPSAFPNWGKLLIRQAGQTYH